LIDKTPIKTKAARLLLPSHIGEPYYIFLLLPYYKKVSYKKMREVRKEMLEDYCTVVRYLHSEAQDIVGLATESGKEAGTSEDAAYFDGRIWTEQDANQAKYFHEELGFLKKTSMFRGRISEYPQPDDGVYYYSPAPKSRSAPSQAIRLKPKNPRNLPCYCGSSLKYKKCHGS
jgi:hypothetical protein